MFNITLLTILTKTFACKSYKQGLFKKLFLQAHDPVHLGVSFCCLSVSWLLVVGYCSLVASSGYGSGFLCLLSLFLLDLGQLLLCLQGVDLPLMLMWPHLRRVFMVLFELLISGLLIHVKFPLYVYQTL